MTKYNVKTYLNYIKKRIIFADLSTLCSIKLLKTYYKEKKTIKRNI